MDGRSGCAVHPYGVPSQDWSVAASEGVGMRRLNGMDAMLLYSETPNLHMHTLKVLIVHPVNTEAAFDFGVFQATVERRLHLLDPLRFRLQNIPLRMHHPIWLEDCDVD